MFTMCRVTTTYSLTKRIGGPYHMAVVIRLANSIPNYTYALCALPFPQTDHQEKFPGFFV
uniref:Uncharacterized protein n=1 Tax=Romanomermis culicivorax TaxID=13658 RepID=A0A915JIW2_ROMCU